MNAPAAPPAASLPGPSGAAACALRPDTVPYIARWSAEAEISTPVVPARGGTGIAFPDEIPGDRDRHGVLWMRREVNPGAGEPQLSLVHSVRQRYAMRRLRCQVCRQPADRNEQGVLWLLEDGRADRLDWPESELTAHPPACAGACVETAIERCRHLRDNWVTVRVNEPVVDGVYGRLYRPGRPLPAPVTKVTRLYEAPDVLWVLASQLVATLNGCTVVRAWAPQPRPATAREDLGAVPPRTAPARTRRRQKR
ncbi:hypothetical protein [Streptomyces chrestomyceticus]|uniref:hypothetical protein n=1 Tax=Streptomyces chrestomyceticus TaxID=68185 RepID=UPI0033E30C5B